MHFSKLVMFLVSMLLSVVASAAVWIAGSSHQGKIIAPIQDGVSVAWQCDGKKCQATTTEQSILAMPACRSLVKKVGKVTYFTNKNGELWSPVRSHSKLLECNKSAVR